MYRSPSTLKEEVRKKLSASLNARLSDGLDLHSQIKVAHWNIKGPHFTALHPLFETFAVSLANHNDAIAERAVTLGARAYGTVRHAAKASGLPEYDQEVTRDLEHVKLLRERIEKYLVGVREGRDVAEKEKDQDTVDLLTGVIVDFEKHLHRNGTRIIKFYLHLSQEEQRKRFLERIDRPEKNWKFNAGDLHERGHWDEYQAAYQEAIAATATPDAPWYVVPADNKWFTRLVVVAAMNDALEKLDLRYPEVSPEQRAELAAARVKLEAENGR